MLRPRLPPVLEAASGRAATHLVWPENEFIVDLLPDLVRNHAGWRKRSWVEDMGLYWQSGHDGGMEFYQAAGWRAIPTGASSTVMCPGISTCRIRVSRMPGSF
jgi:hypothetical protein